MKRLIIALIFLVLVIIFGAGVCVYFYLESNTLTAVEEDSELEAMEAFINKLAADVEKKEKEKESFNNKAKDPNVRTTIAQGLSVEIIEVRSMQNDTRTYLHIKISKEENIEYLVDALDYSCTIFFNASEFEIKPNAEKDVRTLLALDTTELAVMMLVDHKVAPGDKIYIEWKNLNPKSNRNESIKSKIFQVPEKK